MTCEIFCQSFSAFILSGQTARRTKLMLGDPGPTKGDKKGGLNLVDLCLQMAITNKDRNLEYNKIIKRDIVQTHFLDTAMEKVLSVT